MLLYLHFEASVKFNHCFVCPYTPGTDLQIIVWWHWSGWILICIWLMASPCPVKIPKTRGHYTRKSILPAVMLALSLMHAFSKRSFIEPENFHLRGASLSWDARSDTEISIAAYKRWSGKKRVWINVKRVKEEDSVAQNAANAALECKTHRWVSVGTEEKQISGDSLKSGTEDGLC